MSIIANYFYDYQNGAPDEQFRAKEFFKDLLEAQYLAKLIRNFPPVSPPAPIDSSLFKGDPSPQPNISSTIENQNLLIGELLSSALANANPEAKRLSIVDKIKKDNLQIDVLEELITQFENGSKSLKSELAVLRECN